MKTIDNELFRHSVPVQLRFNDIDSFGHVNNATYQEFFDLGRLHYFKLAFNGEVFSKELALVIASIKTDFLLPVSLHDAIKVCTKVAEIGNKSIQMVQQIVDVNTGEVKATCHSVMVCFKRINNQTEVIPQSWRDLFTTIETD